MFVLYCIQLEFSCWNFRDHVFPCVILVLAGVKSSWSQCALSLPLNQDLGWSLWLQGFSLSLWLRLEHAGSCTTPGLTRKASFSTASESSSASDWGIIGDAWTTKEHGKYTKCLGTAGHCTMASCCVICKCYNTYKLIQCSIFLSVNGLQVFIHFFMFKLTYWIFIWNILLHVH